MYPSISLCMIVKNEEDWLEQCLKSVKSIITEIILVDTGSTDRGIEIAQAYGAKIYAFEWTDDFSAARNFSLQYATGDWIFILDADEAIAEEDLGILREKTLAESVCYEFLQRHYTADHRLSDFRPCRGEYPGWEKHYPGYFESNLCRMFPNHRGVHYRGRIHELVEHSIKEIPELKIERCHVPIHHYGHTPEVKQKKLKSELYSPLGETKVKEQPKDWKAFHELGVEHNCNGRYQESAEAFTKAVELNPNYLDTWINYGYVLCELGRYDEAEQALRRALVLKPGSDEALCNLGVVNIRKGDFARAAEIFIRATAINPLYVNAFCNLGVSFAHLGRLSEAANAYYRAMEVVPQCAAAKIDLGTLLMNSGYFEDAERLLQSAACDEPWRSSVFFTLGVLYKRLGRKNEAADELERYCALEENKTAAATPAKLEQLLALRKEIEGLRGAL